MYPMMYRNFVQKVKKQKEINVIGVGIKFVKSDMVILSFDLITEATNPVQAQIENEKLIERIKERLNQFGIRKEDIFFSINELTPIYDENNEVTGFKASTIFRIIFYDIQLLNEFLYNIKATDIIVKDVLFTVKDPIKHWNEAIEEAVSNAYERAAAVAAEMDVMIERTAQDIVETTDPSKVFPRIYRREQNSELIEGFITIYATVKAKYLVVNESPQS